MRYFSLKEAKTLVINIGSPCLKMLLDCVLALSTDPEKIPEN